MGANAKRKREAKLTARIEARKDLGGAPAAMMCMCGGHRHPYGSTPPRGAFHQVIDLKTNEQRKQFIPTAGRTHGCPLRKGHPG